MIIVKKEKENVIIPDGLGTNITINNILDCPEPDEITITENGVYEGLYDKVNVEIEQGIMAELQKGYVYQNGVIKPNLNHYVFNGNTWLGTNFIILGDVPTSLTIIFSIPSTAGNSTIFEDTNLTSYLKHEDNKLLINLKGKEVSYNIERDKIYKCEIKDTKNVYINDELILENDTEGSLGLRLFSNADRITGRFEGNLYFFRLIKEDYQKYLSILPLTNSHFLFPVFQNGEITYDTIAFNGEIPIFVEENLEGVVWDEINNLITPPLQVPNTIRPTTYQKNFIITPEEGYYGLKSVNVNLFNLLEGFYEDKTKSAINALSEKEEYIYQSGTYEYPIENFPSIWNIDGYRVVLRDITLNNIQNTNFKIRFRVNPFMFVEGDSMWLFGKTEAEITPDDPQIFGLQVVKGEEKAILKYYQNGEKWSGEIPYNTWIDFETQTGDETTKYVVINNTDTYIINNSSVTGSINGVLLFGLSNRNSTSTSAVSGSTYYGEFAFIEVSNETETIRSNFEEYNNGDRASINFNGYGSSSFNAYNPSNIKGEIVNRVIVDVQGGNLTQYYGEPDPNIPIMEIVPEEGFDGFNYVAIGLENAYNTKYNQGKIDGENFIKTKLSALNITENGTYRPNSFNVMDIDNDDAFRLYNLGYSAGIDQYYEIKFKINRNGNRIEGGLLSQYYNDILSEGEEKYQGIVLDSDSQISFRWGNKYGSASIDPNGWNIIKFSPGNPDTSKRVWVNGKSIEVYEDNNLRDDISDHLFIGGYNETTGEIKTGAFDLAYVNWFMSYEYGWEEGNEPIYHLPEANNTISDCEYVGTGTAWLEIDGEVGYNEINVNVKTYPTFLEDAINSVYTKSEMAMVNLDSQLVGKSSSGMMYIGAGMPNPVMTLKNYYIDSDLRENTDTLTTFMCGVISSPSNNLIKPFVYTEGNSLGSIKVIAPYWDGGFDCDDVDVIENIFEGAEELEYMEGLYNLGYSFTTSRILDLSNTNLSDEAQKKIALSIYDFSTPNQNGVSNGYVKFNSNVTAETKDLYTAKNWLLWA